MKVKIISILFCMTVSVLCSENQKAKTLQDKIYENRTAIITGIVSAITAGAGVYYYYFVKPLQNAVNKNNGSSFDEILNNATSIDDLTNKCLNQLKQNLSKEQPEKLDELIQKEKNKLADEHGSSFDEILNNATGIDDLTNKCLNQLKQNLSKEQREKLDELMQKEKNKLADELRGWEYNAENRLNLTSMHLYYVDAVRAKEYWHLIKTDISLNDLAKFMEKFIKDPVLDFQNEMHKEKNYLVSMNDMYNSLKMNEFYIGSHWLILNKLEISAESKNVLLANFENVSNDPIGSYINFEKTARELKLTQDESMAPFLEQLRQSYLLVMFGAELKKSFSKEIV